MELLVNDLSLHGQFSDLSSFRESVHRLMVIRQIAKSFGRELHCHRNMAHSKVTPDKEMLRAIQVLTPNEQRSFMQWLTRYGPFWEEVRNHGGDDWIEHLGEIVTDTAIAEAAWCCLRGIERGLVSFTPSDWCFTPVTADWILKADDKRTVGISNYWCADAVEAALRATPLQLLSWDDLKKITKARCTELIFGDDTFAPLDGHPFVSSAAKRILLICDTLNRFKTCFDTDGQRTPEGHTIFRDFFTGKKEDGGRGPLFSDASDSEKNEFKQEMTFLHPENTNKTLFCTWHGKVQTPPLRVHFSWPIRADEPLYVMYVGPKITKR